MTPRELGAVAALAGIFSTRLLGLFLILPVFALYAETLEGYTPFLAGFALGAYGLSQACLQLLFGMASDRLGRKPVIAAGLVLFAIGSAVAALADSMVGVIIGRIVQGAGAIGAPVIALVADATREQHRTRAMAIIGITVGASFLASILLGPALDSLIGVPGIFWLTAGLGLAGLVILWVAVPSPAHPRHHADVNPGSGKFFTLLREGALLRLNIGIFILHAVLTAMFVVLPGALVRFAGLPASEHSNLYLPIMLVSAAGLFPLLTLSERRGWQRQVFAGAVLILGVAQVLLYLDHKSLLGIGVGLLFFFAAFNVLEASLPSLVSKTAPANAKGTAIGIYSTFQFLGAAAGGAAGGWAHGRYGMHTVFGGAAVAIGLWFLLTLRARARQR